MPDAIDNILKFKGKDEINKLLMNTRLKICTQEADIDIVWLCYHMAKKQTGQMISKAGIHKHSFHEIHFCLSGNCIYQVHGRQYTISPGDIIILKAEEFHCMLRKTSDFCKVALGFSILRHANDLSEDLDEAFGSKPVLVSSQSEELAELFYAILREFSQQKIGYLAITNALLFQIIVACARLHEDGKIRQPDFCLRIDHRISEINVCIEEHLNAAITCKQIADEIHLSTRQINRIIQNEFGVSLSAYVEKMKCACAKNLLLNSDIPISKIASQLGYQSQFSFSKFFKRVEGMPPSRFRRSRFDDCAKQIIGDD